MGTYDIPYFSSLLQDGAAYRVTNFICIKISNFQQTLDTETTLKFGKTLSLTAYQPKNFQSTTSTTCHTISFTTKCKEMTKTIYEKQPTLTDYIGCLTRVGNVRISRSANTSQKVVRKLDIQNLNNGNVVELALWDDMTRNFYKNEYDAMDTIAVSSCRVTTYGGKEKVASVVLRVEGYYEDHEAGLRNSRSVRTLARHSHDCSHARCLVSPSYSQSCYAVELELQVLVKKNCLRFIE